MRWSGCGRSGEVRERQERVGRGRGMRSSEGGRMR